ncbi:TPA: hypothetical protein EYP37_08930 [Candidatus Poribacteria bacterium]|nr:hypothetical protein [Candidatus Poribacteria bacterium]
MSTRVKGVVLRQRRYWMGWPGAAYPVDRYEREYPRRAVELGGEVGVEMDFAETIYDAEGVERFLKEVKSSAPDGLLLIPLSMGMWSLVDEIVKADVPTVIFASIGTAFTGHISARSRRKGVYFISSLDFQQVRTGLRMIDVKRKIAEERVLVLKGESEEPVDTVVENLGIKIRKVGRGRVVETYKKVGETEEVKEIAGWYEENALKAVEPSSEDLIKAARMYITCRRLLEEYEATAITMDCLGLVGSKLIDTTPCMGFSKLNDDGIPAACEADLDAILTMILLKHTFGKPSFMNDPVPETVRNILVAAHCTSPTRLDGYGSKPEPFILRSHSESNIGVSMQVLWREGQEITLAKFQGPKKMIVGSGTVIGNVDTPPAGGCRTSVEVEMKGIEDVRDTKGFHQLLFYGDHAGELKDLCQLLNVDATPM